MKKFLLIITLALSVISVSSCSSKDDEQEIIVNNFENADYIKSQIVGKWNYWGHFSTTTNSWWYSGDVYKHYFTFNSDNTYTNKSFSSNTQTGTYSITPATKTDNAILYLNYKEGTQNKQRQIYLKSLENKTVTIYESSFDERYDKE